MTPPRSTGKQVISSPSIIVDSESGEAGSIGVAVHRINPVLMSSVVAHLSAGGQIESILRVTVAQTDAAIAGSVLGVSGRYEFLEGDIRFVPYFPFERGLSYRVTFDPGPHCQFDASAILTLEFSLPQDESALPTQVEHIFPSSDSLPENLLRFYVYFSNTMQRGQVKGEISLLGPDGQPVVDVLYRAPVELWDRTMQVLTILLDPGRLKRGVGPNRELGSPLEVGQEYTLVVGAGMTDLFGRQLGKLMHKRFNVTEAVRQPVLIEHWVIASPTSGSRMQLVITFPTPLDWAMLFNTISIVSSTGGTIGGRITIDQSEKRWLFTPSVPWAAGSYYVCVDSALEDSCGNNLTAAFDRPLRAGDDLPYEVGTQLMPFDVASLKSSPRTRLW